MMLPDVNVLINAYRVGAQHHREARAWLIATIEGTSNFGISKLVLSAFVRIVTHRGAADPTPPDRAFAFCENLLNQPHCEVIEPGPRHWSIFQRPGIDMDTRGPKVTDAWLAALAIEWGCEWVTFDRDFLRFPGLKCTILQG